MSHRASLALVLAAALAAAAPALALPEGWTAEETAAALIDENGGIYADRALAGYVQSVGERLAAAAGLPGKGWRFTVLDTPDANAFALPDRQIFVTRGMLTLANDEAELAAILGHEIGHALAGDAVHELTDEARRASEFAADRTGMRLMVAVGYDPTAESDFLATLLASRVIEAGPSARREATRAADNHPALPDRLRRARDEAAEMATAHPGGKRERGRYLAAIDGLIWGDGAAQGFLVGRSFVHPDLRFAFETPAGYALANRPDAVIASGPAGAMLLLDSLPDPGGTPEGYLVHGWVPEIARGVQAGPVEAARAMRLNGMAAAQAQLPLASRGSARVAELTVVRHDGRFYRLTGLHEPNDTTGAAALAAAAASFRSLPPQEAAKLRPLRIRVHRIARGENVEALARSMPIVAARAWFDVLNGLEPGDQLRVGDLVKVVTD
jgi:predicted Zn-dependent protease